MFETFDKMMMAGLGAMSMTRERAEKIFDEYVSRGKAERDAKSGFVKEVLDSADRTRKEMEKIVSEQTKQVVESMHLATKEDLDDLRKQVGKLEKQISKLQESLDKQDG
jgi:poly(hydroxyalkanoate) granule-associated protein